MELLAPHIIAKVGWGRWSAAGGVTLATSHSLAYPSGLFKVAAREGAGGLLPADARVPHMVTTTHQILATWTLASVLVTTKAEIALGARMGETWLPSIDLPWLLTRSAAAHRGWRLGAGLDVDGELAGGWSYFLDLDVFLLPYRRARYALEHAAMVYWHVGDGWRVGVGYKMIYAQYPYGTTLNLGSRPWPFPLADVQWAF